MPRLEGPTILMCPPDYFGIEYEINAWMSRAKNSDHATAMAQWRGLHALLLSLGARVELLNAQPGLPDMVFTANAGLVFRQLFVTSHFRPLERRGESEHFERWAAERGFRVVGLPEEIDFEGAGDALFCGDILCAGYLHRSDIRAHRYLAELLGCQVLSLELVDPHYYHLDTCFCPLAAGTALYYPPAFDEYALRALRDHIPRLIEVEERDARSFACNAVVVGKRVVVNECSASLVAALAEFGFETHCTPLSEFLKAGGAAKCLTLRLDGEEAAYW